MKRRLFDPGIFARAANALRKQKQPASAPASAARGPARGLKGATLLITHAEVCNRQGVGALLMKIFENDPALMVIYSRSYFDGECFGAIAHHLPQPSLDPADARATLAPLLAGHSIARILCVPFYPDDAASALAAAEITGAPLVTYIMDDQNLFFPGIPDGLMGTLIGKSTLCFAISEVLRAGYAEKFGKPFFGLPPVNSTRNFAPRGFQGPRNLPPRGVMIGNVWNAQVLQSLREVIRESGLPVDWYGNAGKPFIQLNDDELAADGIRLHPNLTDAPLVEALRRFDYAMMPSGELKGEEHDWLFRASLPSRLIYLLTSAHLPCVVLGSAETAAGQFVERLGLGEVVPYQARPLAEAVRALTGTVRRDEVRAAAASWTPVFAAEGVAEWIWRSAAQTGPADNRYEMLFAMLRQAPGAFRPDQPEPHAAR